MAAGVRAAGTGRNSGRRRPPAVASLGGQRPAPGAADLPRPRLVRAAIRPRGRPSLQVGADCFPLPLCATYRVDKIGAGRRLV
ncbi:hypothetical protein BL253_25095 [Pseudofrankia asymbiotica]|uniref:Uncharacterized protein n=1 Tax=Pseudofrankia asymbiotica TaxID=1834516 RepID=A0A1V2I573_9ACTN|nr:hypothetical protein BL253_25095 [Pseudofrankia asymbiotica]